MMYNKFLILENDEERKGLPNMLKDVLDNNKGVELDIWWRFKYDLYQRPKEVFQRFANIQPDTLCVTYPSFIGYDNEFEQYVEMFAKLKEKGIKIRIAVLTYKSFYWFLLDWFDSAKPKYKTMLKSIILYHEIYDVQWDDADFNEIPIETCMKRITFKWMSQNLFKREEVVMWKGVEKIIASVSYREQEPEKSHALYYDKVTPSRSYSTSNRMPLTEITRIKKSKTKI